MSTATPAADFFSAHRSRLDEAVEATRTRGYYSAFPESPSPKVYGETAGADGAAAFEALLGGDFPLSTPGADGTVATEKSPFGKPLDLLTRDQAVMGPFATTSNNLFSTMLTDIGVISYPITGATGVGPTDGITPGAQTSTSPSTTRPAPETSTSTTSC